jgi:hypothetical protein
MGMESIKAQILDAYSQSLQTIWHTNTPGEALSRCRSEQCERIDLGDLKSPSPYTYAMLTTASSEGRKVSASLLESSKKDP